jgi:DNA-binding LacI/PurR family transcriptional regulator
VSSYPSPAHLPFDPVGQRWHLDQGVHRWLRALPKPVGVFVPNDDWGIQLAQACRQLELLVPEDVALLGVDDDDLYCELTRPRLSSIVLPAEPIGYEAAALLDRLLMDRIDRNSGLMTGSLSRPARPSAAARGAAGSRPARIRPASAGAVGTVRSRGRRG